MSVAKDKNSFIDHGTDQITSAGFVNSSGKDALNNNYTWEFFLSKRSGFRRK